MHEKQKSKHHYISEKFLMPFLLNAVPSEPDWWNTAKALPEFDAKGYRPVLDYSFPYTSCPSMASMSGEYAKCELKCRTDVDCPLLHHCCPNGCGRLCVPVQVDAVEDCGCSVTFLEPGETFESYLRVSNLVWETLSESFIPALEPYIVQGVYQESFIGPQESRCSFKRALEFDYQYSLYTAFGRPSRFLFIISDDPELFQEIAAAPLNVLYNSVCAVSVGNISVDENLVKQLSVSDNDKPCLWSVDSFKSLGNVASDISAIVNDGLCLCEAETIPSFPCRAAGVECMQDNECEQPTHVCNQGLCSQLSCSQPEIFDPMAFDDYDYYTYDYYYDYSYYYGIEMDYFHEEFFGFYEEYDYFFLNSASKPRMSLGSKKVKEPEKKHSTDEKVSAQSPFLNKSNRKNNKGNPRVRVEESIPSLVTENKLGCCSWYEFQCSGVPTVCVTDDNVCDGVKNCFHGDDETPEACAKRKCGDKWFKCNSGQCIPLKFRCDGTKNCPDGSDENCLSKSDCPSVRPHYCSSGECIDFRKICNKVDDCKSRDDEIHCRCTGYRCSNNICVSHGSVCNGVSDCDDGSDEPCRENNGTCPKDRPFKCENGKCIENKKVCNRYKDCDDGTDEDLASCSPESCFYCDSGQCVSNTTICDGFDDCADRSDESNCKNVKCAKDMFKCNSGECVYSSFTCDGREDCADGSDELICDICPDSRPLRCSSGVCIGYTMVCDGIYHCTDKSDESKCMDMTCPVNRPNKCDSGQCIPDYYGYCLDGSNGISNPVQNCERFTCTSGECVDRCDGFRECDDGSDEDGCEGVPCPLAYEWRCKSGECIMNYSRCDGSKQCNDGSDELECQNYKCSSDGFKCGSGECKSRYSKCDGYIECKDGSDEKDCIKTPKCSKSERKCKSGECIYEYEVCDGYRQCFDGSDEDECQNFPCPTDRSFRCKSGVCKKASRRCDGFISCADGSDEEDCTSFSCPSYRPFSCPSGVCITYYQLCNGVDDCGDGSDELDCGNVTCPKNAFKCNTGNCIPPRYRCNGDDDCQDGEDELNCENYKRQCEYLFPCVADNECLPTEYRCDGSKKCSDGSDEKDCPPKGRH